MNTGDREYRPVNLGKSEEEGDMGGELVRSLLKRKDEKDENGMFVGAMLDHADGEDSVYYFRYDAIIKEANSLALSRSVKAEVSEEEKAVLEGIHGKLMATESGIIYFNTEKNGVSKNVAAISGDQPQTLASMLVKAFNQIYEWR